MASKKKNTKKTLPLQPEGKMAEFFYTALEHIEQTMPQNFMNLEFHDLVDINKAATALMIADLCGNDLELMTKQYGLKPTTFYKYRRLAHSWGIDACKKPLTKMTLAKTSNEAMDAKPDKVGEDLSRFDDVNIEVPEMEGLPRTKDDAPKETTWRELTESDNVELFEEPLPKVNHASDPYKELVLTRIA